jgi:hypothetical protein
LRDQRETDDEADMEHRWGQRRETRRSVYLRTHTGLAAHGLLRNVSVSGAFILTPLPVAVFTRVQLFLAAEGKDRRSMQPLEAEVVRRTLDGIAIEWKEFDNAIFVAMGEIPGQMPGQIPGQVSGQLPGQMAGQMHGQVAGPFSGGETRSDAESSASTARKAR